MNMVDELRVPDVTEEDAGVAPVVAKVADVIGSLAATEGLVSPGRFQTAISVAKGVGKVLGEPSLTEVLALRALSSPSQPAAALAALRAAVVSLSAPERAAIMWELGKLVSADAKPGIARLAPDVAAALNVPLPDEYRHDSGGILDALGSFADRAKKLVRSEPAIFVAVRDTALEFGEVHLLADIAESQRTGDQAALMRALSPVLARIRRSIEDVTCAAEAQENSFRTAQELDAIADRIESVAQQRYAAIKRRATMMKRHIREDLNLLIEDAGEEFEVDFRRLAENKKGWFGRADTADLNDRMVVKNLERRYRNLARRYQDQLDLFDREVSEFCDEFTRVADEAFHPMARHDFQAIAPHPALELRMKAAADRASTRALVAGAAGAVVSSAAVQGNVPLSVETCLTAIAQ